ncbi:MAG TPA: alpha/beta hydrolase [Candidatus Dormibacteraeota bacterium]|nr:alpha/beta hydrolase [Candidatus Dormibacteraeota bacterium]
MIIRHHIIYVPGLGDDLYRLQSLAIKLWRLWGVNGHTHPMPWSSDETFDSKLARLLTEVDRYLDQGHNVSLVGASAGASAVLHAYAQRRTKIAGLVYLCGKINHPQTVSKHSYSQNPGFKQSLETLPKALEQLGTKDRSKIMSLYSIKDGSVPYRDTLIDQVLESRLPALRHPYAILWAITFGARKPILFLKQTAEQM